MEGLAWPHRSHPLALEGRAYRTMEYLKVSSTEPGLPGAQHWVCLQCRSLSLKLFSMVNMSSRSHTGNKALSSWGDHTPRPLWALACQCHTQWNWELMILWAVTQQLLCAEPYVCCGKYNWIWETLCELRGYIDMGTTISHMAVKFLLDKKCYDSHLLPPPSTVFPTPKTNLCPVSFNLVYLIPFVLTDRIQNVRYRL